MTTAQECRCNNSYTEMMDMVVHFGERELILFAFWKTGTFSGMACSMFIVFLLCILYEAIKGLRYFVAMWYMQNRQNERQERDNSADAVSEDTVTFAPLLQLSGITKRLFTGYRLLQGGLYGVQALLAYALMLIVMTFNANLILAVVVGEAVGYFLFTGTPLIDGSMTDCH